MKQFLILFGSLLLAGASVLALVPSFKPGEALPEYSAQTGEPCATCHVSPSGGGPPRPAWAGLGSFQQTRRSA